MNFKTRPEAFIEAITEAEISTARDLAEAAQLSEGTAQTIFRGEEVALRSAIKVVRMLQARGIEASTTTIFESV